MVDIMAELSKPAVLDNIHDKPKVFLQICEKINLSKISNTEQRILTRALMRLGKRIIDELGDAHLGQTNVSYISQLHKNMLDAIGVQNKQFKEAADDLLDLRERNMQIKHAHDNPARPHDE